MTLALLCPGQGGQNEQTLRHVLQDSLLALKAGTLLDCLPVQLHKDMEDPSRCMVNEVAQPLVVLAGVAVIQAILDTGLEPDCVAGYSVGEVTAQFACGGLDAISTLELAMERGRIMSANSEPDCGLMAVTQIRYGLLETLCESHGCFCAIINGEDHTVVAGRLDNLESLEKALAGFHGAVARRLPVSVPSHSPLMQSSGQLLADWCAGADWGRAKYPVVSGLNGHLLYGSPERKDSLVKQMTQPVHWHRAMQSLAESGCKVVFEVGPGNAMSRMMQAAFPGLAVRSIADFSSMQGAIDWLKEQVARA